MLRTKVRVDVCSVTRKLTRFGACVMESRVDHLDKMKRHVVITQKIKAEQCIKCKTLTYEVEACHRMIQSLQLNACEAHGTDKMQQEVKSASQFRLKERPAVGEILVRVKHEATSAHNVILEQTNGIHSVVVRGVYVEVRPVFFTNRR